MKVYALIVTYNRLECLKKSIDCLVQQTIMPEKIIIIDNCSMDGTQNYCEREINDDKLEYIRLQENTGGAGGFYEGIKLAVEEGADYVWGMDDDAFAEISALEEILKEVEKNTGESCYWSNCDNDETFEGNLKCVNEWMFVGFMIPTSVVNKVGLPRKDFFIYLDDFEYAKRIRKNGFKIYKVKSSVINHKAGTDNQEYKKILCFNFKRSKLPDWKYYYWIRNYIMMYSWNEVNKYLTITFKMLKIFLLACIFDKGQIKIFWKAYWDGIKGIGGKQIIPGERLR